MENFIQPDAKLQSHQNAPQLWPDYLTGQPGQPVRVLLIDDDAHIRQVIAQELHNDLRTDLVAQASSMREGRRLISLHDFDVMLVDLNLGDGSGFKLIEQMKIQRPRAEAVVISTLEDEESALRAFEAGATGYFVKYSWFGSFPETVLQVVNGGAYITPKLARRLLQKLTQTPGMGDYSATSAHDKLSEREKDVLKMIASGYTSVEIGPMLSISSQTVNAHVKNIYRKLQVHSRAQAVSYAVRFGML